MCSKFGAHHTPQLTPFHFPGWLSFLLSWNFWYHLSLFWLFNDHLASEKIEEMQRDPLHASFPRLSGSVPVCPSSCLVWISLSLLHHQFCHLLCPLRICTLLIVVVVFPLQLLLLSPLYLSVLALLCGNTMISVLWYAELIGYARNMTSNMYCWALPSLPSKLSLQEIPYTGACGRCGHTLKTPRKCTCSLAHLGVWQWPISLNKTMGEVRYHIPKWLSGKESVCVSRRHRRCGFDPWARKMPWRRACQPTLVFLPENPMDGGGWQAAICGVTKSWTWLKRLVTHA